MADLRPTHKLSGSRTFILETMQCFLWNTGIWWFKRKDPHWLGYPQELQALIPQASHGIVPFFPLSLPFLSHFLSFSFWVRCWLHIFALHYHRGSSSQRFSPSYSLAQNLREAFLTLFLHASNKDEETECEDFSQDPSLAPPSFLS